MNLIGRKQRDDEPRGHLVQFAKETQTMKRARPINIAAKPLLSTVLLVVMAFGLSGCPAIYELFGDAPFNGVYCDENSAGCHDREPERSSDPISTGTGTPNPSPSQPTGPTSPENPT